jgi:hypothetical protein
VGLSGGGRHHKINFLSLLRLDEQLCGCSLLYAAKKLVFHDRVAKIKDLRRICSTENKILNLYQILKYLSLNDRFLDPAFVNCVSR